ncbi:TPA: hypothetical protein EYO12_03280 [Candidatus Saccharibacteria bacterium]|nr:hypothetical protein [Candidatus Saccharibacteria bacterium]HIO87944.1 hypothetical protein [Candidatus Saccharibacteria bacterium]
MTESSADPLDQVERVERGVLLSITENMADIEHALARISDGGLLHKAIGLKQFLEKRYVDLTSIDYMIRANMAVHDNPHEPRSAVMQAYIEEEAQKVQMSIEQHEHIAISPDASPSGDRMVSLLMLRLKGAQRVLHKYQRDEEE